jgi:hypothetical protein
MLAIELFIKDSLYLLTIVLFELRNLLVALGKLMNDLLYLSLQIDETFQDLLLHLAIHLLHLLQLKP